MLGVSVEKSAPEPAFARRPVQGYKQEMRWSLIRLQFGWALVLQAVLNFAW